MARYILLLFSFAALITVNVYACDCDYGGPFLKMAPNAPFVALVKITKYLTFKDIYGDKTPMSMEVEIIETYKGKENRKAITVWGDPGHLCRPYLSTFKKGQYYVIAFNSGDPNSALSNEKVTDYSISNCGAFWLTVDISKKLALGDINSTDRKSQAMDLIKLKAEIEKNIH